ncbi:MAG: hypothetical protein VZQ83_07250 [Eubacterium sp.]|nr:hypothetical protein [Eubacterium sp.]
MNASKIEQTIEDIYKYLDTCKPSKFYANKVSVDKDELMDLLEELRLSAPDEIRRYQKVITNRDDILNDAQKRAETMLSQAQAKTNQLLDESEIMQAAYTRAEEIMRQANEEATMLLEQAQKESDELRRGALAYTNDLLADAKLHIQQALKDSDAVHQRYQEALKQSATIIEGNQNELMSQLGGTASQSASTSNNTAVESSNDQELQLEPAPNKTETLELDEDAFLKEDL